MKKYIEIEEEVLARLVEGKCVEGSIHRDQWTGKLSFRAYQRTSSKREPDKVLCYTEHGWLKESKQRIKLYESVPKQLGLAHVRAVLERETEHANDALLDIELDLLEFC